MCSMYRLREAMDLIREAKARGAACDVRGRAASLYADG